MVSLASSLAFFTKKGRKTITVNKIDRSEKATKAFHDNVVIPAPARCVHLKDMHSKDRNFI